MSRDEIVELLPELQALLKVYSIFFLILVSSVFVSYLIALWLWSQEQIFYATVLASLAFIVFYLLRQQLVEMSCIYLNQDARYKEMVVFVRKNLYKKSPKVFISQLEKAVAILQKSP